MFHWLLTIFISLNLAVSSVPRCGMIRHVVMAILDTQTQTFDASEMSCHQVPDVAEKTSTANAQGTYLTDAIPCPCHLAKFSYIWVLFDLATQPQGRLIPTPMAMAWATLLSAYAIDFTIEPPPPRSTTVLV